MMTAIIRLLENERSKCRNELPDTPKAIARQLYDAFHAREIKAHDVLSIMDGYLETCGIEHVTDAHGSVIFYYCNTGDDYARTLVYYPGNRHFTDGAWADCLEFWEWCHGRLP
jgi:hypothetical protein